MKKCDCEVFQSCPDCRPKFPKPGKPKKKTKKTELVKTREIQKPDKMNCVKCNRISDTECHRHAESKIIKFLSGGGITGGKIPDTLTAWLCENCNAIISEPIPKTANEYEIIKHALDWALAILKTHNI